MDPKELPLVGAVFRFGAQDRVLDSILLAGPLVVAMIAVFGRSTVTEVIAVLYVCSFVVYVFYLAARRDPE